MLLCRERDLDEVLQTTAIFANVGKGIMAAQEDLQVRSQLACSWGWRHMASPIPQNNAFIAEPQQSQHVGGMLVYCMLWAHLAESHYSPQQT